MTIKIIQPTYLTKLPSTGETVKFRPFNVREEKALLLALQEDDIDTITNAIKNTIIACTFGEVAPEEVPYYDVEYLYLQIRSKSIGEIIELRGSCDCTEKKTEFSVDIADIVIEPKPGTKFITKIPDTGYSMEFRHPSIDDFSLSIKNPESSETIVASCIVSVFTDDEIMNWSKEEKLEFVESMTTKQQRDIAVFLENMPLVKIPTKYKCVVCGKEHISAISGFESFFV